MAKHGFVSTGGSDGSSLGDRLTQAGYAWRAGAELVGVTATLSAEALFASLTGNLGGRQLLLSSSFTECGIAEVDLVDNQYYWCIDLAAR
jgi:uncharacterized protein YkwD